MHKAVLSGAPCTSNYAAGAQLLQIHAFSSSGYASATSAVPQKRAVVGAVGLPAVACLLRGCQLMYLLVLPMLHSHNLVSSSILFPRHSLAAHTMWA